jgi:hypothetical protein
MFRTRLHLKPGQPGTKKLMALYGKQLVGVRYQYDDEGWRRRKTVELSIEEADWHPEPRPGDWVALKVKWGESQIASKVKGAGGRWDGASKVWFLPYRKAKELGLEGRIAWGITLPKGKK